MSVPHAILGILAEGPAHGYDVKHAHDRRFAGARPLAYGQVYAALAKLEKDDLVQVVERAQDAGPERMTYAVTEAGHASLVLWLATTEPAGPYAADELVRKTVTALRLGHDAADFLARQRQVHLAAMRSLLELQTSTVEIGGAITVDHAVEHLDADLRWLETAAARVDAASTARTHPDDRKVRS